MATQVFMAIMRLHAKHTFNVARIINRARRSSGVRLPLREGTGGDWERIALVVVNWFHLIEVLSQKNTSLA